MGDQQALHEQFVVLYSDEKYGEALGVLRLLLENDPGDQVAIYNAACTQVKLGHHEKAAKLLQAAVTAGFVGFDRMKHDPDLEPIREHPIYTAILEAADQVYAMAADHMVEWSREMLGPRAIIEKDEDQRIVFATSLEAETYQAMRTTLDRQMKYQSERFFGGGPTSFVLLMVPTPREADRILRSVRIGGYYDHDRRQLVTRDIGSSLRHEATHLLHHAQMDRLNQPHPMWIQEGIASAFEMYDFNGNGELILLDNARINIAINLLNIGGLMHLDAFLAAPDVKFMKERASAKYAQARAVFQYLAERGKLESWYAQYLKDFPEDPTGITTFESIFARDIKAIDADFRTWMRSKEKLPEKVRKREPALGLWVVDQMANDGVLIAGVHKGGAGRTAGVRTREIITAIDGKPVYSVEEVVYEIRKRQEGDEVTLRLRRVGRFREVKVRLAPVKPSRLPQTTSDPGVAV